MASEMLPDQLAFNVLDIRGNSLEGSFLDREGTDIKLVDPFGAEADKVCTTATVRTLASGGRPAELPPAVGQCLIRCLSDIDDRMGNGIR